MLGAERAKASDLRQPRFELRQPRRPWRTIHGWFRDPAFASNQIAAIVPLWHIGQAEAEKITLRIQSVAAAPKPASEFRRRREQLHLTVRQLALAMGVSPGLISMMQTGKRPIRRVYWLALAQLELLAALHDA